MILLLAAALAAAAPACPPGEEADAYLCRAVAASDAEKFAEAAALFDKAAAQSPKDDPKTQRMLAAAGNMWIAAGQPGKAAFDLDKALTGTGLLSDQRGLALLDRARAAEAQNDLKAARRFATQAGETIGEDPFLWYFSAALAIRENDPAAAKTAITKALTLAPDSPEVLFEAGHVAHFTGDDRKARDYWNQADKLDTGGTIGRAARAAVAQLAPVPADAVAKPPAKP